METEKIELTNAEKVAKEFFYRLIYEGSEQMCDVGKVSDLNSQHPDWFDENKFKRGQQYFKDNQYGIMGSNMCGLFTLLCEPKGLLILSSSGKSSTAETARKRYVSTTLSMLAWYEMELTKGSKSWESLNRVRRLHLNASNASAKNKLGMISQSEIAVTAFGFMGFALIKPHLLGIKHDNKEDREGFVHFWAVMCYMLGLQDRFNICLNELEVVEVICHICLRYIFIPLLQIETPQFIQMATALVQGLSQFVFDLSYDSQMFLTRRVAGIPGYQYDVDLDKEIIIKHIFTTSELIDIHKKIEESYAFSSHYVFNRDIELIDIKRGDECYEAIDENIEDLLENMDNNRNIIRNYKKLNEGEEIELDPLSKVLGLRPQDEIVFTKLDDINWKSNLNDSKYYNLSMKDKFLVRSRCRQFRFIEYKIGNYICTKALLGVLFIMKRWQKKQKV